MRKRCPLIGAMLAMGLSCWVADGAFRAVWWQEYRPDAWTELLLHFGPPAAKVTRMANTIPVALPGDGKIEFQFNPVRGWEVVRP